MRPLYRIAFMMITAAVIITLYALYDDTAANCPDETPLKAQLSDVRDHISTARRQFDALPLPCDAELSAAYEETRAMLHQQSPQSTTPITSTANISFHTYLYAALIAVFFLALLFAWSYYRSFVEFSLLKRRIITYHSRICYEIQVEHPQKDIYNAIRDALSYNTLLQICNTTIIDSFNDRLINDHIYRHIWFKKTLAATLQICKTTTSLDEFIYHFEKLLMMIQFNGYIEFVYRYGADNMKEYFFEMMYYQLTNKNEKINKDISIGYNGMENIVMGKETLLKCSDSKIKEILNDDKKCSKLYDLYAFQHHNYHPYELQMMRYLLLYIHDNKAWLPRGNNDEHISSIIKYFNLQ